MTKENLEEIKKVVSKFFAKMGIEAQIEIHPFQDKTLPIDLKVKDPQPLIGESGETLFEIQHLLKAILKRNFKENFYLDLDINAYKKKKIKYLKDLAQRLADEVALTKKEKILPSMPAYERRIIHLELAERKDVTTESTGQEPERKVVIKPYP